MEEYDMLYSFLKIVLPWVFFPFIKVEIKGLSNIPAQGPVVLISNHSSNWDPLILGIYLPRKLSFMAKEELFKTFFLGLIVRSLGAIPVKRGAADRNAIRKSIKVLEEGKVLSMFPEGTRSKTGEVKEFQPGAVMIAYKGNANIVPVGLRNTSNIGKGLFTKININIGDPIDLNQFGYEKLTGEKLEEISKLLQNKVIGLVENK